jgi:hypothetical protein
VPRSSQFYRDERAGEPHPLLRPQATNLNPSVFSDPELHFADNFVTLPQNEFQRFLPMIPVVFD